MLSIGALKAGQENYYLEQIAKGAEDYYLASGEEPGRWLGALTGELGLDGEVDAEDLQALLGGLDPRTGDQLGRTRAARGWDCSFSAPKAVSVLWGLADDPIHEAVRAAHDAAVDAAVGWIETEATWSRYRVDSELTDVPGRGVAAAVFTHRVSRLGDPQLHSHVLVPNLTAHDRGWGAIHSRRMYRLAKTAGYLYQAHLRAELTQNLGVEWGTVSKGSAELVGMPGSVLRSFSQRRAQILEAAAEAGTSSRQGLQVATFATRQRKTTGAIGFAELRQLWRDRVPNWQHDLDGVTGRALPRPRQRLAELRQALAGPRGLTERSSTFQRSDAVRAFAEAAQQGAAVDTIVGQARDFTNRAGSLGLVARSDDPRTGQPRWTTQELLDLETRLVNAASQRATVRARKRQIDAAIAQRPSISAEQADMVRALCGPGNAIRLAVGPAGTGKTFALDAARQAWQASGIHVVGCALAAKAAAELAASTGIPAQTIDLTLMDLERSPLPLGTVVLVDEAAMTGTRKLAHLHHHVDAAGGLLVLVGDHRQLAEIDAGGLFEHLATTTNVVQLRTNRRQQHAWERTALTELRNGDLDTALAAFDENERVHHAPDADAIRELLTQHWFQLRDQGHEALVLAATRSDVADLNHRIHQRLVDTGQLEPEIAALADGSLVSIGDRVICTKNNRRDGLINGDRGTLTHVDNEGMTFTNERTGEPSRLPTAMVDQGHLALAYATTVHKAQGQTTEHTLVLGSDLADRRGGYVALSRGRQANHLYVVDSLDLPTALSRERSHELALEQGA